MNIMFVIAAAFLGSSGTVSAISGTPMTGYLPTDQFELFHINGPVEEFEGCAAGVAYLAAGQEPYRFSKDTVVVKFFNDHTNQCKKDGKLFRTYTDCEMVDSVLLHGGRFLQCHGKTYFYEFPETLDTEYSEHHLPTKDFKLCQNFKKYPDNSRQCRTFWGVHSKITRPLTD